MMSLLLLIFCKPNYKAVFPFPVAVEQQQQQHFYVDSFVCGFVDTPHGEHMYIFKNI